MLDGPWKNVSTKDTPLNLDRVRPVALYRRGFREGAVKLKHCDFHSYLGTSENDTNASNVLKLRTHHPSAELLNACDSLSSPPVDAQGRIGLTGARGDVL